jgi:methyl-accepting chemotaxis protein
VVAEQVRTLAEQTSTSSRQIAVTVQSISEETAGAIRLMQDVVSEVGAGREGAGRAGHFMQVLRAGAENAALVVSEIVEALAEQSVTNDNVARHVETVALMAGQNRSACGLVADYAERMQASASGVDDTVRLFRVS